MTELAFSLDILCASVCAVGGVGWWSVIFSRTKPQQHSLIKCQPYFSPSIQMQTQNAQTITKHFVNGFYFFSLSRGSHFAALSAISHYIEFSRDKIDILIHLSIGNTNWRHSSITSKFISTDVQIDDDRKFTAAVVVVSFFSSFAHTQWTPNVSNINETKIIRWRRRIKWIFQASKKKNCFQYSNGIVLWIFG